MGQLICFYSYKGGVGRTMALANVAVLLGRWGYRVLAVDWDLEAPGLEWYFRAALDVPAVQQRPGLIDLLSERFTFPLPPESWAERLVEVFLEPGLPGRSPQLGCLHLLSAGRRDEDYFRRVRAWDIDAFYADNYGGQLIEALRDQWKERYDFVLVDSRTGVTDLGGICTVQLPDLLVALFAANEQSLRGTVEVAERVLHARQQLPVDRLPLAVVPVPSRFETLTEFEISRQWLDRVARELEECYLAWAPAEMPEDGWRRLLEVIKVPYLSYFSFGEKLPVLEQGTTDPGGLGYAYETLAALVANGLERVDLLLSARDDFVRGASDAALRASWSRPTEVPLRAPPPPADFTGRDNLLKQFEAQLTSGVVAVGLHGLDGMGKTAVALKLAERLAERFPDGQLLLHMADLSSAEAMGRIVRAFHPTEPVPPADEQLPSLYRSVLAGKRVLLLLDNAASAEQIEPLLPPGGSAAIVTSQRRLTVRGLVARDLGPLATPAAATLLRRLAPRLDTYEAADLAKACGGMPLALCLVGSALAARPDLSPSQYLDRLRTDPLRELAPLAEQIRLNESLLLKAVRTKWRELVVLVEGFEAAWAAAVWGVPETIADGYLGTLLETGLLHWDAEARLYRLQDLLRDHADTALDGQARQEAQQRHARYFCKVLQSAERQYHEGGEGVATGLRLFDRAWSNALAGFAWAAADGSDEKRQRLCCAFALAAPDLCDLRRPPLERITWLEEALAAARRLPDQRPAEVLILDRLGAACAEAGQPEQALEHFERALEQALAIGDRRGEGLVLGRLEQTCAALGQTDRAAEFGRQQLALAEETRDPELLRQARWAQRRGQSVGPARAQRAFLSSSLRELTEYREAAIRVCRELALVPVTLELFGASDALALDSALRDMDEADAYVGLFAHRYGWVPPGQEKSIGELEYDRARQRGLPRLCFVLDADYPWPPRLFDIQQAPRLEAFKERLRREVEVQEFTTVEDFSVKLYRALSRLLEGSERPAPEV